MNIFKHITIVVSVITILALASCDYRRPSDSRFENATGLELPDDYKVLEDEYLEAGKDYTLQYNVQLDEKGMAEFTKDIRSLKNYSATPIEKNEAWIPSEEGYFFFMAKDGKSFTIEVDTILGRVRYNEAG